MPEVVTDRPATPAAPSPKPAGSAVATARSGSDLVVTGANGQLTAAGAASALTRGGKLHHARTRVRLCMSQGHIYTIDDGESWMIQAEGYLHLNQVTGLQFVMPPTVPAEGREFPNPYVVRTADGRIEGIYIRGAVVGRDRLGTHRVVMETLYLEPEVWFQLGLIKMADFDRKANEWDDAARIVRTDSIPAKNPDYYVAYPIDDRASVVVDLRAYKVRKAMENRVAVRRDFTKRALTVLQRRLFRAHPGCPSQRLAAGTVTVLREKKMVGWGDRQTEKDVIVEATVDIPVIGWIDDSPVQQALEEAIRRGKAIVDEALVDDLGTASTVDADREDSESAIRATRPVEVQPESAGPAHSSPKEPTGGSAAEAKAVLQALRKIAGGRGRATELVAKWTRNEVAIEDLSEGDLKGLIDDAVASAQELATTAAQSQRGGAQ